MTKLQNEHVTLATSFVDAVKHVFREMVGWEVLQERPTIVNSSAPTQHVTGVISVIGKNKGIIALGMDRSVAIKVTEQLLERKVSGLEADVVDATSELVNMISGQVRARLKDIKLEVSLPVVILGKSSTLNFPNKATRVNVPFRVLWGELSVDFAFAHLEEHEASLSVEQQTNGST